MLLVVVDVYEEVLCVVGFGFFVVVECDLFGVFVYVD